MKRLYLKSLALATLTVAGLALGAGAKEWYNDAKLQKKVTSEQMKEKARRMKNKATKEPRYEHPDMQNSGAGLFRVPAPRSPQARSAEAPRGQFTFVSPVHSQSQARTDAYYAQVNATNGRYQIIATGDRFCNFDYEFQTGVVRGNHLYIPFVISGDNYIVYWQDIDATTGEDLGLVPFEDIMAADADAYSMAWDSDKDVIYTLCYDNSTWAPNQLSVIDPNNNFAATFLGADTSYGHMCAICYNPADKQLYAFNAYNEIYLVNTTTGDLSPAGEIDIMESLFLETSITPMCYSPKDESFVVITPDDSAESAVIYYINPEDWTVTRGMSIQGQNIPMISSFHCLDPYAVNDAPALPDAVTVSFSDYSLDGSYSFKVPELLYSGVAIPMTEKVHTVITLDGKELLNDSFVPGHQATVPLTVEEGEHTIEIICDLGDDRISPPNVTEFYTGYDIPEAPSNLKLEGSTLSWTAPGAKGIHGGFVNPDNFIYQIYVNNVLQNVRPHTDCSYNLTLPAEQTRSVIEVEAVANRKTSPRASLTTVFGKPMNLPVSIAPTKSDSDIILVVDANGDATFQYWKASGIDFEGYRMQVGYYADADDWVILPQMNFPSSDKLYNFTFDLGGILTGYSHEDLEVCYGTDPTPEAMTNVIYDREYVLAPFEPVATSIDFAVPEPGNYYIGIHYKSLKSRSGRGLTLRRFNVSQTETASSVPGYATDITVKGGEYGALEYEVNLTFPTIDALGNPLPEGQALTAWAECDGSIASVAGTPGAKISRPLYVDSPARGFRQVNVWVTNSIGSGAVKSFRAYGGIDTPLSPTGFKMTASRDNHSVDLEWEAPGPVGVNGGYVDEENLDYIIYSRHGVQYLERGRVHAQTNATYEHGANPQYNWLLGPIAANEAGQSPYANFIDEVLGVPNEIPQIEIFGTTAFNYTPIIVMTENEFAGSHWENNKTVAGLDVGGVPSMSSGGCLLGYNESYNFVKGGVSFPKVRTDNTNGMPVEFSIRIWDYSRLPRLYLMGRCADNQELTKICELEFERPESGKWAEPTIILPEEYQNQPWVQLRVYADLTPAESEYIIIDNYKIFVDVDFDAKVYSLTGPAQATVGSTAEFHVVAANAGKLSLRNVLLRTQLTDMDGKVLAVEDNKIASLPNDRNFEAFVNFAIKPEYADMEKLKVVATAIYDGDMLEINNTQEVEVIVVQPSLPFITDLSAKTENDNVELQWSEPDLTHGAHLDFETDVPFVPTDMISGWQNVTLYPDRKSFAIEGLKWEGMDEPQAWAVIDAEKLGLMHDQRLHPHSGKQYIMARALEYNFAEEVAIQAAAWLISPEVVGGTDLSLWVTTVNKTYDEFFVIYYSTTDTTLDDVITPGPGGKDKGSTCGSFKFLETYKCYNDDDWEQVTITLPEDAKYVAICYRSYDEIGLLVDDIDVTPRTLDKWVIDHYSVWRTDDTDWQTNWSTYDCIASDVKTTSFTDTAADDKTHSYFVAPHVVTDKGIIAGPRSNLAKVYSSGVEETADVKSVYGTAGAIVAKGLAGTTIAIYSPDGKYLRSVAISSDSQRIAADAGIYLVKAGTAVQKVLVK